MTSPTAAVATQARVRCSWSAEERAEWLRLLQESGQALPEFCRQNDLPESTVSLWRRQQRGAAHEPGDEGTLVEVSLEPAAGTTVSGVGSSDLVTIHLPSGIRLEAIAGTDPAWLAELARSLQGA